MLMILMLILLPCPLVDGRNIVLPVVVALYRNTLLRTMIPCSVHGHRINPQYRHQLWRLSKAGHCFSSSWEQPTCCSLILLLLDDDDAPLPLEQPPNSSVGTDD